MPAVPEPAPAELTAAAEPAPAMAAVAATSNGHSDKNGKLQADLWQAAKIVAEAATASAAVFEPPPAPMPIQMAAAPNVRHPAPQPLMTNVATAPADLMPAVHPLPVASPSTQVESNNIAPLVVAPKGGMDRLKWVIFGSAAAFLGVIWAAIWFAAAK
jgi:hypothetical protein